MTKKKEGTAEEAVAIMMRANPVVMARFAREEEERQQRAAEWRRAEQPLVEELRRAGFQVDTAWDLVNTKGDYPKALPILLKHVQKPYPGPVREGIARAMAVPSAKFAWDVLVRLYRAEQEVRPKDGLAVALAAIADGELLDQLIALVKDTQLGESRVLLLSTLARSKDPRARAALMSVGDDPQLEQEVQATFKRWQRRKPKR
jgi:hypothetical protein